MQVDFTLDDAAAVCLYTFDFGGDRYDMNPYNLLNRRCVQRRTWSRRL